MNVLSSIFKPRNIAILSSLLASLSFDVSAQESKNVITFENGRRGPFIVDNFEEGWIVTNKVSKDGRYSMRTPVMDIEEYCKKNVEPFFGDCNEAEYQSFFEMQGYFSEQTFTVDVKFDDVGLQQTIVFGPDGSTNSYIGGSIYDAGFDIIGAYPTNEWFTLSYDVEEGKSSFGILTIGHLGESHDSVIWVDNIRYDEFFPGESPKTLTVQNLTSSNFREGSNHSAANLIDGNLSTRWSSLGTQWAEFDLGENKKVDQILIAFYRGDLRTADFDVQLRRDGADYYDDGLREIESSGQSLELQSFPLSNQGRYRYVRLIGKGNSQNDWNSILEVEIKGFD